MTDTPDPTIVVLDDGRRYGVAIDGRVIWAGSYAGCQQRLELLKRLGNRDQQDEALNGIIGRL